MKTKIIYEDDHILVCHKPPGLATQTSGVGQPDMVSELKNYLSKRTAPGNLPGKGAQPPYLGVIHRLDQPVEGLLVFAKDKKTAAKLTAQLAAGVLNKRYYAVVCGEPAKQEAELVDYLSKDAGSAIVTSQADGGKKAVLQYRVIGRISAPAPISLLDIHIDTGRFHQIRAQMAHAGLPLLGDRRYGSEESGLLSRELQVHNVALCACQITLKHPVTDKTMEFSVRPAGEIFAKFA